MKKIISKNKRFSSNYLILILLFLALFVNITSNTLIYAKISNFMEKKITEEKELARPADLKLVYIEDSACTDCFDIQSYIDVIKKENVNIISENELQRDSDEAQDLIAKYDIKKIPTFIVEGEINKETSLVELWTKIGEIKDDKFIFNKTMTPYVSAESGEVKGKVDVTIISDKNCKDCFNADIYENFPKQLGMSVTENKKIEYRTTEGRNLVKKYNIKALPTIIISGDLESYAMDILKKFGKIQENTFVLTEVSPPYLSIASNLVKGGVYLTVITDNSCKECYNVAVYDNIIKQFGLYIKSNKQVDVSSYTGKALVHRYKIEAVPTIVMTGDVDLYNKPGSVWSEIGTTESNGAYVVREEGVKQLGAYKNLSTKEIISKAGSSE